MGFYLNLASFTVHTDQCKLASGYAKAASKTEDNNWAWYDTYTEAFLRAASAGDTIGFHVDCAAKPDSVDNRIIALYKFLVTRTA